MALPDVHVEVAFDTDPLTRPGALDWTRIDTTCELRGLSTRRGAGLRDGTIVTGSASATLDNRTGDLLPENTGGTWYPDLTLRKRIRFMKDGTDPLFTGFIDRLPVQWDKSGSDGLVELEAVDLLALLAQIELPPSVLHQTIVDLDPVAYWPLAETQGITADDVVGTWDGQYRRPVSTTGSLLPFDARARGVFGTPTEEDPTGQAVSIPGFGASGTQTISAWCSTSIVSAQSVWIQNADTFPQSASGTGARLLFGMSSTALVVYLNDGTTGALAVLYENLFGPTHIALTIDTGLSSYKVVPYINGQRRDWNQATPANPVDPFASVNVATAMAAATNAWIGYGISASSIGSARTATVGDVAYWDSVLTDEQIASIYEAGVLAWSGDTTGARLGRVLDAVGVDDDDRDIDTGIFTCGPTQLGGNALEYLRKIAATERGALFVSADGKVTFQQQYANDPTPLDVIGDAGCPYSDITLDYSLDRMVNQAEVTAENGISHTFKDSTAVTAFGPLGVNRETLHSSPSGAKSLAAELVVRNKDLRTQVVGVELESRRADVPSAVSVDTEIGDPYTISYEPPGVGSAQTVLVRVESISHRFTSGTWTTRFDVDQQVVLPDFQLDTAGAGADQGVLAS